MSQLIYGHRKYTASTASGTSILPLPILKRLISWECSGTACLPQVRRCRPTHRQWTEKGQIKHRLIPSPSMPPLFIIRKAVVSVGASAGYCRYSNIYLAELENPWTIKGRPVRRKPGTTGVSGFWVNEGPADAWLCVATKAVYQLFGQRHR